MVIAEKASEEDDSRESWEQEVDELEQRDGNGWRGVVLLCSIFGPGLFWWGNIWAGVRKMQKPDTLVWKEKNCRKREQQMQSSCIKHSLEWLRKMQKSRILARNGEANEQHPREVV